MTGLLGGIGGGLPRPPTDDAVVRMADFLSGGAGAACWFAVILFAILIAVPWRNPWLLTTDFAIPVAVEEVEIN